MRFRSLQLKLVVIFGLCLIVAIGSGVAYSVVAARRTQTFVTGKSADVATQAAQALLVEKARAISFSIEVELEVALDTARTLAYLLAGIKDPRVRLAMTRDQVSGILRSIVEKNSTFLGMYTVWEPDAFDGNDRGFVGAEGHDDTGRFIPYWDRNLEGALRLEATVNYENATPHPNGVRKGEYYLLPRERQQECVIDPYPYLVQGQTAWIVSSVVPILAEQTFYGIAGVDLRGDFLQALVDRVHQDFYGKAGQIGIISYNGILAALTGAPQLIGQSLKEWMTDDWQEDLQLIQAGQEKIKIKTETIEVILPIKTGKTGMPWAVAIELPKTAVLGGVQALTQELRWRGRRDTIWQVAVGASILLVILGVIWGVSVQIVRPLKAAAQVAHRVAEGDVQIKIAAAAQDEVGQVLRAMTTMVTYLQGVAQVAERVAAKDLNVTVTPQSERDVLNHALSKMVVNLDAMLADNTRAMQEIAAQNTVMQQQNWVKDGLSQLSAALAGEKTLDEVCRDAIGFIARYVNAGQGVLYVYDAERSMLTLRGTFAFVERDELSNTYKLGEGVIGQVALERTPILLRHVDRAERLIQTGTFSGAPLNTSTFPLVYNDELYGVFELASFESFDRAQQDFLDGANRVIATALFSSLQRDRVQSLLRQSQEAAHSAELAKADAQHQAEEARKINVLLEEKQQALEQQSEELRQMNVRLEEREQELRQQQEELRQQNERLKRG